MDPTTSTKTYWPILRTILDNKAISCIQPIYYNNNYMTAFKEKAEIFNNFFAKQCTIVKNTSKLSTDSLKKTNNCLSTISFTNDGIAKIIKQYDPNKAHSHVRISIPMSKICGDSTLKSLELMFKSCIESGKFLIEWKKSNVARFIKNGKQLTENYFPISLLQSIIAPVNQAPNQRTSASINYCVLLTLFINLLMMASRQGLSLLTYQKNLIRLGMTVYSIN